MNRLLILLYLCLKSFICLVRAECNSCQVVYFFKCLQKCPEVGALYFNNTGYNNWDNLESFPNLTIYRFFLDDNMFKTLNNTRIPKSLEKLKILYLKNNRIEAVPELVFSEMKVLSDLNLASNKLTCIHVNAFKFNLQLENLVLDDNVLDGINFLAQVKSIKILSISNNNIAHLDVFYDNRFENLTSLYLNWNCIEHIKQGFFDNLPVIKDINLEQNKIHTIESTVQVRRTINLSHNQLNCFNFTNFTTMNLNSNTLFCEFIDEIKDLKGVIFDQNSCKENPNDVCEVTIKTGIIIESHVLYILIPCLIIGNIGILLILYISCKTIHRRINPRETGSVPSRKEWPSERFDSDSSHTYEELQLQYDYLTETNNNRLRSYQLN